MHFFNDRLAPYVKKQIQCPPCDRRIQRSRHLALLLQACGLWCQPQAQRHVSGEFSKRSFALAMSPRRAHLFFSARFGYHQGKQAGPSYFGVGRHNRGREAGFWGVFFSRIRGVLRIIILRWKKKSLQRRGTKRSRQHTLAPQVLGCHREHHSEQWQATFLPIFFSKIQDS